MLINQFLIKSSQPVNHPVFIPSIHLMKKHTMRIAPNSDVVGTLNQNTRLRLLENRNQWSKVQIDAWVANDYLDKAK